MTKKVEEKRKEYPKHYKRLSREEIMLILSYLPTNRNREYLSSILQRTQGSIEFVWWDAYDCGFREDTERLQKIRQIKDEMGISRYLISIPIADIDAVAEFITKRVKERAAKKENGG